MASAEAGASGNTRRRVKLYLLNDDGQWDDRGTGHISCQYNQDLQGFGLFLRSEADNEELLGQRVVLLAAYCPLLVQQHAPALLHLRANRLAGLLLALRSASGGALVQAATLVAA